MTPDNNAALAMLEKLATITNEALTGVRELVANAKNGDTTGVREIVDTTGLIKRMIDDLETEVLEILAVEWPETSVPADREQLQNSGAEIARGLADLDLDDRADLGMCAAGIEALAKEVPRRYLSLSL